MNPTAGSSVGVAATPDAPPVERLRGPDLRDLPPLEQQIDWLNAIAHDGCGYAALWISIVQSIGDVSLLITRNGEREMVLGRACDSQERERASRLEKLSDHLDQSSHLAALIDALWEKGRVSDNRPHLPGLTTECIRDFLSTGARVLVDPEGRLLEGGEVPRAFINGTPHDVAEWDRAARNYYVNLPRKGARTQIARAARLLGRRTNNGWIVLEKARG